MANLIEIRLSTPLLRNQSGFFVSTITASLTRLCQVGGDKPYGNLQKALRAEVDEAAWTELYSTKSRPFDRPETGKIAVKVINHHGDEVLKVFGVG